MNFSILNAIEPTQSQEWETFWQSWPTREVHAHPQYVSLFADCKKNFACCAIWHSEHGSVLYPFILRYLTEELFWTPNMGEIADIISPYGYGGAFVWGEGDRKQLANEFWNHFSQWAVTHHIISEFIRFTLLPETILDYPGEKEVKFQNVICALHDDEAVLWMKFEQKVRKNVKKAQRSNVEIEIDQTGIRLDDFLRIYNGTMERNNAQKAYYFSREFFEQIHTHLAGQFVYFHALYQGAIISTELVLISAENVYSFLGGTNEEMFDVRPNDLIKYAIIKWAKEQGKLRFVLGGGYLPDDGIFRYKRSFAPEGSEPFSVGYRIFHQELYDQLVNNKIALAKSNNVEWAHISGYFPLYRA